jgi:hypothetical protein
MFGSSKSVGKKKKKKKNSIGFGFRKSEFGLFDKKPVGFGFIKSSRSLCMHFILYVIVVGPFYTTINFLK